MSKTQLFQIKIFELFFDKIISESDSDLIKILVEYHEFMNIFNKKQFDKLSKYRHYNYIISL